MSDPNQPAIPGTEPVNAGNATLVSNKFYNVLKPLASLYFPLVLALYSTLSQIWGWPLEVQIVATLGAVQVLLGGLLLAASKTYSNSEAKYDGEVVVDEAGNFRNFIMNTGQTNPEAKDVVFKVTNLS